jgi:hypothetical protein
MSVADKFVEAARSIDGGHIFFPMSAMRGANIPQTRMMQYWAMFEPLAVYLMDSSFDTGQWRVMSLLFAGEMAKTGDLK